MKYKVDWNQTPGRVTKTETHVILHPIDMVAQVHKKKGLDEACALALELIHKKYMSTMDNEKA